MCIFLDLSSYIYGICYSHLKFYYKKVLIILLFTYTIQSSKKKSSLILLPQLIIKELGSRKEKYQKKRKDWQNLKDWISVGKKNDFCSSGKTGRLLCWKKKKRWSVLSILNFTWPGTLANLGIYENRVLQDELKILVLKKIFSAYKTNT